MTTTHGKQKHIRNFNKVTRTPDNTKQRNTNQNTNNTNHTQIQKRKPQQSNYKHKKQQGHNTHINTIIKTTKKH